MITRQKASPMNATVTTAKAEIKNDVIHVHIQYWGCNEIPKGAEGPWIYTRLHCFYIVHVLTDEWQNDIFMSVAHSHMQYGK